MTDSTDFVVYNMPGMLSKNAVKPDPRDPAKWVRDESWYESVQEKMTILFDFYRRSGLLRHPEALQETASVVLKLSDFSERGQRFIRSGASDTWLASFDRPGAKKKVTDVSDLEKQLTRVE